MQTPEFSLEKCTHRVLLLDDDVLSGASGATDPLCALVSQSGQRSGRIVILPAAAPDPVDWGRRYARRLLTLGAGLVTVLHVETRSHANDENAVIVMTQATGILMLGDQHELLTSLLEETELLRTIRQRQREGCVIAATRAGYSLLGSGAGSGL